MALKAPRSLNAPIGCRFSGLIQSGRSASAHLAGISGVRTTAPLTRSAAAWMSSRVTSCTTVSLPLSRSHTQQSAHHPLGHRLVVGGTRKVNRQSLDSGGDRRPERFRRWPGRYRPVPPAGGDHGAEPRCEILTDIGDLGADGMFPTVELHS